MQCLWISIQVDLNSLKTYWESHENWSLVSEEDDHHIQWRQVHAYINKIRIFMRSVSYHYFKSIKTFFYTYTTHILHVYKWHIYIQKYFIKNAVFYYLLLNLITITLVDKIQESVHLFLIGNIYSSYSGYNGRGIELSKRSLLGKCFWISTETILSLSIQHCTRCILIQFSCLIKFSGLSGTSYTFPVFSLTIFFFQMDQLVISFHN